MSLSKEVYQEAYNLIKNPRHWTQVYPEAINKYGEYCYCLGGAIAKAVTGHAWQLYGSDTREAPEGPLSRGLLEYLRHFATVNELIDLEFNSSDENLAHVVYGFNDGWGKFSGSLEDHHGIVLEALENAIEALDE